MDSQVKNYRGRGTGEMVWGVHPIRGELLPLILHEFTNLEVL